MAKKQLTLRSVPALRTKKKQEDFWDSGIKVRGVSFGVRVTRLGSKEFILRYRLHGKYRRMSIGDATKKSLVEAHGQAIAFAKQLEEGKDPADIRDQYKVAETCNQLFDLYLKHHASKKRDGGTEDNRIIERDLRPAIGLKKACDVTRRDIIAIIEHIANDRDAVIMSNRTRSLLSKIFNFAIEREILTTTPCAGLSAKRKEHSRERVLKDTELKDVLGYLKTEGIVLETLFKFMLCTAARPGETVGAKWEEIDLSERLWLLPASRTKNGKPHIIPLANSVVESLTKLRKETGVSAVLFPSNRNEFVSIRTIQNCVLRAIEKTKCKHFTAHDLRRTAATGLRSLGAPREVVSKILNHTPQSVTAVYDRHQQIPEMRKALERWSTKISALSNPKSMGKLVELKRAS